MPIHHVLSIYWKSKKGVLTLFLIKCIYVFVIKYFSMKRLLVVDGDDKIIQTGSVLKSSADIIAIPHSTVGTVSDPFKGFLEEHGVRHLVPGGSQLGDIVVVKNSKNQVPQFIAFCCSVDDNWSHYSAIRKIGHSLGKWATQYKLNQGIKGQIKIASPIMGSGAGRLNPLHSAVVLYTSFNEINGLRNTISIYNLHPAPELETDFNKAVNIGHNSLKLAFLYSIESAKENAWIKDIANASDFYFQKASDKYHQYLKFQGNGEKFFENLLMKYENQENNSFELFLNSFSQDTNEYKFILMCGELISYIDRNALNKAIWNEYPDKRTIAKSNVRQPAWLKGLLNFKRAPIGTRHVPPSIYNALFYLANPLEELSMLSENHRAALLKNIFGKDYNTTADLAIVFETLDASNIQFENPLNRGACYSRILYLPEIKELWKPEEEEAYDILEESPEPILSESEVLYNRRPVVNNASTIQASVHSDLYAKVDLFNYQLYAKSIVKFLTNKNTRPPLTVGIMAPWGKGKTTLMRFIIDKLNEERSNQASNTPQTQHTIEERQSQSTYENILNWLKSFKKKGKELIGIKKLEYPTVWFNAWKFQKEEQIWAGFAHEIIQQLVNQITDPVEREKFWLYLNAARINSEELRMSIYKKIFQKIVIPGVFTLVSGALSFILLNLIKLPVFIPLATGVVISILPLILYFLNAKKSVPDIDITKYIKKPVYSSKMGYLYEVEQDLKRVLQLLVSKEKPAVIFIDDLDRCAPNTTTEVVEAINLFINGDLPECYFVIGQDAQMVAAALDVAYKDIGEKVTNVSKNHGSLGWYFMEKFVQLQFNIPILNKIQCQNFFKHLFKDEEQELAPDNRLLEEKVAKATEKINSTDDPIALLTPEMEELENDLLKFKPEKAVFLKEKIIEKMANEFSDNDNELDGIIEELVPALGNSPRKIKRFVNLYRFYRFMQFSGQNKMLRDVGANSLGRWIVIMIRWPQLVRAIQWEADTEFITGISSLERAQKVQDEINKSDNFETWQARFKRNDEETHWMADSSLYSFIKTDNENHFLSRPVELGMW